MGGKAKQAPRTKGNARPASSSKASLQLDGFTSCLEVKSSLSVFNEELLDIDATVDESFQMVLRKMSKKDPTTKIKALKEFADLVVQSEVDIVKNLLPFFAKAYVQLSTDCDARVRENSQNALLSVVNKVGRNVATVLKQVFPAWVCGQYDTHPTAASIATNCFGKAFPSKNVTSVFGFCESEILDYFTKNLIVLNAQTVCNPKTHTPEESEAKYQRLVISSLRGYALYLEKIAPDKLEEQESANKNLALIGSDRFWGLHKSKSPYIRSSFFEALSSLLQNGAFLLKNHEEQLSCAFKAMDETDPSVLSHIWACVILIQVKIDNWSQYVNINKTFLPKLSKILRSALYPCIVYPNLLPLLSKLNKTMLPDGQLRSVHLTFFENINFGLRNVQMGKSETSAVASAYYETLKYTIIQVSNDADLIDDEKISFCSNLLDDHIIAVIFWCINSEGSFGKFIFHHIASLLSYWSKNSQSNELYKHLLNRFWSELYQVLRSSMETSNNIGKITSSHVELIKCLRQYSTQHQKVKSAKIKFEDSTVEPSGQRDSDEKAIDASVDVFLLQPLNQLVYKMCGMYTEQISATHNVEFVENLEMLVRDNQSLELFKHLAGINGNENKSIFKLYDTFSSWLLEEELRCEAVIEIVLLLYKYLKPSEKIDLLQRWIKVPSVQSWIILRLLSHPYCLEPDVLNILKTKEVTDHLVECAKRVANGVYKENLIILQKCFFQTEDGSILIDIYTCGKIVDVILEPLTDASRADQMDLCSSFLAQIFPVICSENDLQHKIFLNLFELSLRKDAQLSEDTLWEVTTAWQDALSSKDIVMQGKLSTACAKIVSESLKNLSLDTMSATDMKQLTENVTKLIMCSSEKERELSTEKSSVVDSLISQLLQPKSANDSYIENLSLCIELMRGNIVIGEIGDAPTESDYFDALNIYIKHKFFNLEVIISLSCNIKKPQPNQVVEVQEDDEDEEQDFLELQKHSKDLVEEEEATEDFYEANVLNDWTDEIFVKFFDVCYAEAVLNVLLVNSNDLPTQFQLWIISMQEGLKVLMENAPEDVLSGIQKKMFSVANERGGLWTKCLLNLLNMKCYSSETGKISLYEDSIIHTNRNDNTISYVNILQTFSELLERKALPITTNLFESYPELLVKVSAARSLMRNHLNVEDYNIMNDRKIVGNALIIMNEILTRQKTTPFLLYNKDVALEDEKNILLTAEIANFLSDVLTLFPTEVDVKRWDFLRIALSSWVLSVSKSCNSFHENKVKVFISAIFRLNAALFQFIKTEKTKSSTEMLQNVIEEWEKVFAKEVNLVLIKSFVHIIRNLDYESKHQEFFAETLCPFVGSIDFTYTVQSQKVDHTFSLKDLIAFALKNLSNKCRGICITSSTILKQLTCGLIKLDLAALVQRNSADVAGKNDDVEDMDNHRWHTLDLFRETVESYREAMSVFIEDFNFKINESDDSSSISPSIAFSYLLLWNCILDFCCDAPAELRSIYARWITAHQFEEVFLVSLFKLMPAEILKSGVYDVSIKSVSNISLSSIEDAIVNNGKYSAFLYSKTLQAIPVVVRKWWHSSNTRKAQLVEKITQNYFSPLLCQQDLTVLTTRKEKDCKDNMHIRVLMQSREVFATYSLEEAKMELSITLPPNYPLGAIKIDSSKHIAGSTQAREIVKQLSIYLTHQNGRLWDGISLWKRNLDRKFEGVEECYVCYSVINQETCQLPRLTCKTCKKKFHSNCLYKWFTSSNKSTCPLCRNVF